MTVNDTPRSQNAPEIARATPDRSVLARAGLIAGGASAGLVASAIAGFGLVSLMFPNSGLPGTGGAALTAAAYMPAPVSVTVMPETQVARTAPAPVVAPAALSVASAAPSSVAAEAPLAPAALPAGELQVAMATPEPTLPPVATPAAAAAPAPMQVPPIAAPASPDIAAPATAAPVPHTVIATKSAPDPVDGPVPDLDLSLYGPRISALPAEPAPAPVPDQPGTFASLAQDDAATRAGAGLFAGTEPAETVAAVDTPLRPAPRPEGLAAQSAAFAPAMTDDFDSAAAEPQLASAAPTRSIRPAARPEIVLAAATVAAAPVAQAPAATAQIAPPTNVVEVSAKQRSTGFLSGGSSDCGRALARAMPSRKGGATGSAFFAGLTNVGGPERDAQIVAELARGNMPGFLHDLQPVTFKGQDSKGAAVEITLCVTPDYLALGSDSDFVRVPLGLPAAARIAGAFDMTLPTPKMVDAIYAQAGVKLSPAPMTPGSQMSTTAYFVTHNATIEGQLQGRHGFVAGHKKDVVMASRMASAPGRVAIYGWHQKSGAPIQPVSTVHGANYADYSHGIRLVSKTAYLNGKAVALDDLLSSGRYAYLLNTDGPMPGPVIRTASN